MEEMIEKEQFTEIEVFAYKNGFVRTRVPRPFFGFP
jgi:hypothetical protein